MPAGPVIYSDDAAIPDCVSYAPVSGDQRNPSAVVIKVVPRSLNNVPSFVDGITDSHAQVVRNKLRFHARRKPLQTLMRRILSDHAQARAADKRGGGAPKLQLDSALEFCDQRAISIAAVDQALRDLEALDARQAQVVELRFFGGLTIAETAGLMALSEATVKREWSTARRWLQREIAGAS